MISIVGLGPSGRNQISLGAYEIIRCAPRIFVRTAKHCAVAELVAEGIAVQCLDDVYESARTFEEVYEQIAELILEEAAHHDVVYAVPGHPFVGESSVQILLQKARERGLPYQVLGSQSFIEASLELLELNMDEGLKIIDALSMDKVATSTDVGNLIYQVYDKSIASHVKLKLMDEYPDEFEVALIQASASLDHRVQWLPLYMLDRQEFDHLTTVYLPPLDDQSES